MYGWRARIGYIVPSSGTVTEAEWRAHSPQGVIFVGSRVLIEDVNVAGVEQMIQQLDRAAREVASAGVNAIIQIGTPVGFVPDPESHHAIGERLQQLTKIPTATMMSACLDALRELGLRRIVVATPYIDELNERLQATLRGAGFSIMAFKGLGILKNLDINSLSPETSYLAAREVFRKSPDADGIFISCGGWRTFEILEMLEQDVGVPVVSSNSAGLWKAFRLAGVNLSLEGLGTLLASHARPSLSGGGSGLSLVDVQSADRD